MTNNDQLRQEIDAGLRMLLSIEEGKFFTSKAVDAIERVIIRERQKAVEEFIELASNHYWDSLANDTPIIRVHLDGLYKMMFPPTHED